VAQHLLHDLRVRALGQMQGRGCVAQRVEPHPPQAGTREQGLEPPPRARAYCIDPFVGTRNAPLSGLSSEALGAVEEELRAGPETPGPETTPNARLACIYAANASMSVVDTVHNTAGTTAMRMDNLLERMLRDSHGAATHRWTSYSLYPELGKSYMGQEGSPEFLGTGQPGFG
jgi:hypothetical protein